MTKFTYFCGIDVSKDFFVVSIKNGKFLLENKSFTMDRVGFEKLEQEIRKFKDSILIGTEPTGIYHENLLHFLTKKGYNSKVVNPYMLHQFFKFTNNKPTKTDKKDSKTIAEFLEFTQNQIKGSVKNFDEKYSIKHLVREKERITHDIAKTKTEIKSILSLVFPEAERITEVFSQQFLSILLEFGGANKIRKTPKEIFIQHFKQLTNKGKGRKIHISPEKIYELACSSIAGN